MVNEMIPVDEAQRRLARRVEPLDTVDQVPLPEVLGRFLAADVASAGPWPATDRAAMDGFAVASGGRGVAAGSRYPVVGEARAGHPADVRLEVGQALRIMTGAVVPRGADVVLRVEDTSGYAGAEVAVHADVAVGANIRPQGSEVAAGTRLLQRGRRLFGAEVAALAVLGRDVVPVVRRPRVAIVATGDEVVDVGATPAPHQIRDSNSWALAAKATTCGAAAERLGVVRDEARALRDALHRGLRADLLLTIGGVSAGTHDLVHGTLAELGVEQVFHGVALKPGKPTYYGRRAPAGGRPACHVLGLPGNPASAFTTFELFAAPLLHRLCGAQPPAPVTARVGGVPFRRNRRAQAVPARLVAGSDGALVAELSRLRPSGDPFGLLDGDGFALVPADADPDALTELAFVRYAGEAPR